MLGLIFGKAPSFNPRIAYDLAPGFIACVNESKLAMPAALRSKAWTVFSDHKIAVKLKDEDIGDRIWCPKRYLDWFPAAAGYDYIDDWKTYRRCARTLVCPNLPYNSTKAAWLLWNLGCDTIYINGIGDDDDKTYHQAFEGRPDVNDQGHTPLSVLIKLAEHKQFKLRRIYEPTSNIPPYTEDRRIERNRKLDRRGFNPQAYHVQ